MFTVCTDYYNLLSPQLLIVSVVVIDCVSVTVSNTVIAELLSCVVIYSVVLIIMLVILDVVLVILTIVIICIYTLY